MKSRRSRWLVGILVALVAFVGGVQWWFDHRFVLTQEEASMSGFIQPFVKEGDPFACPPDNDSALYYDLPWDPGYASIYHVGLIHRDENGEDVVRFKGIHHLGDSDPVSEGVAAYLHVGESVRDVGAGTFTVLELHRKWWFAFWEREYVAVCFEREGEYAGQPAFLR